MTTELWLPTLIDGAGAKYQAIADAIETAVATGRLRGGDRLPPQRELASRLKVDLTTVTKAYDVARQRGLIEAKGRLGSFVREPGDTSFAQLPQVDTGMNMPPDLREGAIGKAIADGTTALLRHSSGARLQYQPPGGALQDRIAGAELIAQICTATVAEQTVLTAGGQNALHAILASTLERGDAIACGRYVYSGLKALAARLGLRLVALPEMSAAALKEALRGESIRALYLVPTNDNPTAHTLTAAAREALAETAVAAGLQIIEDDAYGLLAGDRLPTLTAFAAANSWYVASTSKVISPALRVAFVRAPTVEAALRLAVDVHETTIMPPPINAALVSSWIRQGVLQTLIAEMREEVRARRTVADEALGDIAYAAHPDGYHLWIGIANGATGRELAEAMRGHDLQIIPAGRFAVEGAPDDAIRVSLGGAADREGLARGLRTLRGHLVSPARFNPVVA
ncbi:PLP-dependent aminotransferase family protein [Sphingomonas sp. MMSM20]|uniref:aminotransferase-like domain-containing protein n=1 Tax=Sphingomonas lycopersici TaxID=2951807 RepID=UPI00223893B3|nr:PLP-dependent aminotransferase family protein [Sphingomonas lycopersici]MCW6531895.1 PLP-dependent aminotransferase family protein [Sphingomonas lycopersici]